MSLRLPVPFLLSNCVSRHISPLHRPLLSVNRLAPIHPVCCQSTELKPNWDHDSPPPFKWTNVDPQPKSYYSNSLNSFTIEKLDNDLVSDLKETFFEQYVSHELMLDKEKVKKIYFLYKKYINKNYSSNESIIQLCNILKSSFTTEDLYYNPKVFKTPYNILHNKIMILKEIGFRRYNISMVEFAENFMRMTPKQLENYLNCTNANYCFDSICKTLQIVGNDKKMLLRFITTNHGDIESIQLSELRIICGAKYISNMLKIGYNRVFQVCKKHNKIFNETSLSAIKQKVILLQTEFKYNSNKIIHNGLFLTTDLENLKQISTKLKPIVGNRIYNYLITVPKVLKLNYSQIVQNFDLIKSKCGGKFFTRSTDLLPCEPQKLKSVFEQIEQNEDMKQIDIFSLGIDFIAMNKVKILERIDILKNEEIPLHYVPLSFFQATEIQFQEMILDFTKDPELRVKFYLEKHFDLDYDKIKNRIRTISNMETDKYNQMNANRIVEFLISMNINKEDIIDSIYLILFDYKLVKTAYFNACSRYDKSYHNDPVFFTHIFDYLVMVQQSSN